MQHPQQRGGSKMKGKNKIEIDILVAEKRKNGIRSLKKKIDDLKFMNEPSDRARYRDKQIRYYENEIHSIHIQIRRKEENMKVAAQLYNKNKIREELKIYRHQLSLETLEMYIKLYKVKPKKVKKKKAVIKTPPPKKPEKPIVIPDPVEPILKEEEPKPFGWTPKIEYIHSEPPTEEPIPQSPEERAAEIRMEEIEAETEFPCPKCGRIYATDPARKRHITMRHKEV